MSLPADPLYALSVLALLTIPPRSITDLPFSPLYPTNFPPCYEGEDIKRKLNSTGSPPNQTDSRMLIKAGK